jgi:hypothetical protein
VDRRHGIAMMIGEEFGSETPRPDQSTEAVYEAAVLREDCHRFSPLRRY